MLVEFGLPFEKTELLLERHTRQSLLDFCSQYAEEIRASNLMVSVPKNLLLPEQGSLERVGDGLVHNFAGLVKPLCPLDGALYFFLTSYEISQVRKTIVNEEEGNKLMELYNNCFSVIVAMPSESRRRSRGGNGTGNRKRVRTTTTKTKTKTTVTEDVGTLSSTDDDDDEEEDGDYGRGDEQEEKERKIAELEVRLLKKMKYDSVLKKEILLEWRDSHTKMAVELARKDEQLKSLQTRMEDQQSMLIAFQTLMQQQQQQQPQLTLPKLPVLTLPQQTQQEPTLLLRNKAIKRVSTVEEWVGVNLYNQKELENYQRPQNFHKWDFLFTEPFLTPEILQMHALEMVPSSSCSANQFRLFVRLTYQYPLRMILEMLIQISPNPEANCYKDLLNDCPLDYLIVLRASANFIGYEAFDEEANRINLIVIRFHTTMILRTKILNRYGKGEIQGRSTGITCTFTSRSAPTGGDGVGVDTDGITTATISPLINIKPDQALMEAYFPSPMFYGPSTFVAFSTGLNTRYLNPTDTGSNKHCAFCRTLCRWSNQCAGKAQFSHQPRNCPLLLTISNNELIIMSTIREVLLNTDKKQVDALKALRSFFGVNDDQSIRGSAPLNLNNETLFRFATDEEMESGQNDNSLRLNTSVIEKRREGLIARIRIQGTQEIYTGPKVPVSNIRIDDLFASLYSSDSVTLIHGSQKTLLLDSEGQSYFESKFSVPPSLNNTNNNNNNNRGSGVYRKKKQQQQEPINDFANPDHLFFSFTQQWQGPFIDIMNRHNQFYQSEKENQKRFIHILTNPTDMY